MDKRFNPLIAQRKLCNGNFPLQRVSSPESTISKLISLENELLSKEVATSESEASSGRRMFASKHSAFTMRILATIDCFRK